LVTLALGLAPAAGYAAGLGRLTIHSAIGQPLAADIELVSVRPDELSTLSARVAPPEVYRNANIVFSPALVGARATIERRPGGAPYIRLTSNRPVEEPYIDLLVELTWNTGKLVREYTALVDPPGFGGTQVAQPSPVPSSAPAAAQPVAPPSMAAAPRPAAGGERTYGPVQPGDTLHKIAVGVKPEGVSLDQVLVGIYRSNRDAFINNNMNLLRTGRILRIPEAAELGQIPAAEAGNEIKVHAADWNAYRARVTGQVPETAVADARTAAGKVTPKVEEPAPPPGKEVVKVSKGAPGEPGVAEKDLQERIRVLEEEATAREKTLKDANDRIASLEKTLKDMQRLLEMKGVPTPPPVAVAPPPAAQPEAAPPPADAVKPEAAPPADAAKPEAAAPPPPAVEPKPEPAPAPKPEAKKAEPAPPPPPPAEAWWEDPAVLGGALVALGLIGGLAYVMARRRRRPVQPALEPSLRTAPVTTPVGGAAAAAAAAAAPVAAATTEMPAAAPAAAADDVDPIQEADVYIAYGRDAQAEEILKEALAKDPSRQEIKLKLLEIYAARKSKNDFNALAADLHNATHGRGDLWLKAATMGFALDPENVLYAAGKDSTIASPVGVATDVNLDFDLDMVTAAGAPTTVTDVPLDAGADPTVKTMALSPERMEQLRAEGAASARAPTDTHPIVPDIDLGEAHTAPRTDITLEPAAPTAGPITDLNLDVPRTGSESNVIDFEFDPGKTVKMEPGAAGPFDQTVVISPENQAQARDLGVEIDLSSLDAPAPTMPAGAATPASTADTTGDISFDFELPKESSPTTADADVPPTDVKLDVPEFKPADTTTIDFALDTVSLDLGSTEKKPEAPDTPPHDDHWYDVQTKFDLAKAYQEMGDKEGAREILAEVIKEGDAQQQAEANEMLAKL
jgi:pilus assembly protein FimV